jgi:tetratricopeptide (TPR) repeat protein
MSGREDVFQQAMSKGHSAAWDQLWDQAVVFYRQALDEIPDQPRALTSLGLALYELQQYEEALKCYERAAEIIGEDPVSLEKVAQISERLGDLDRASRASMQAAELYIKRREVDKAIENWSRVTRLTPENLSAHTRLALVFERLERSQQAVTEYLIIASLLQHSGDLEKAVQAVNRALNILPNSSEAHQALELLREFKPLPKPVRSRGSTAPLRLSQTRQIESARPAEVNPNMDPVAEAHQRAIAVLAGMLFEQVDDLDEGEQAARRDLKAIVDNSTQVVFSKQADRTKIMLHLSQAVDLQTRGEDDQAVTELERATEAGLEHAAAFFELGYLHMQERQLEKATRELQFALNHSDYTLASRLLLGQIRQKMGRIDDATIEYLEALKQADSMIVPEEHADALRQLYEPLIEAETSQSDMQEKVELCDNISGLLMRPDWRANLEAARQDLPSEDGSPPMPLGEILTAARSSQIIESISAIHKLARNGQLRSAIDEVFYAMQFAPTYLPLHIFLGELLLQQDHLADAINKFSTVAQTYSARGEPTRAIELLRRIINLAPMDLQARKRLIEQLLARGQVDEVINEYLEMAEVYYSLADLNMARKSYTEGLRLAQQSNADRSLKVQILYSMADIDLQSLDWRQALRVYEQVRTLQPDDQSARISLIDLNFRLAQEAQAMAELGNYLSYLASSGQRDKAVPFLEQLVKEIPDQIVLKRYLADVYRKIGRTEDAVAQLDVVGEKLLASGNRAGAAGVIETILSLNPARKDDYRRLLLQLRGK